MLDHAIHHIQPYLFEIGNFQLRYYGLMYVLGFVFFMIFMRRQIKKKTVDLTSHEFDSLFSWLIIALLIGARFGYVFFYNFGFYLEHPLQIIWPFMDGKLVGFSGMSFHGGLLGCIIGGWIWSRKYKKSFLDIGGYVVVVAPLGLFFGRLGNFLNGELWGRVSDVKWAMYFPGEAGLSFDTPLHVIRQYIEAGYIQARHPSQLYEALTEGLLLFLIMLWLHKKNAAGSVRIGALLIGYAVFRTFCEFFRQPDAQLGFLFGWVTMGQLLSFFMVLGGIALIVYHYKVEKNKKLS
ncbi:MAG: prolipoprotein diacylglyceryl transferase [Candidatus Marinimicrobia bacterium]|nr:prolipoprotein diacylglyceryl transferase [Candidatus Neomarinimicrobiota bacterium]